MLNIEKLKQAALAATQGEWISQHWSKAASDVQLKSENTYTTLAVNCSADDATYIATANPSAVLELIARLEAADTYCETLVSTIQNNNSVIKSRCDQNRRDLLIKLEAAEQDAAKWKSLYDATMLLCEAQNNRFTRYTAMKESK